MPRLISVRPKPDLDPGRAVIRFVGSGERLVLHLAPVLQWVVEITQITPLLGRVVGPSHLADLVRGCLVHGDELAISLWLGHRVLRTRRSAAGFSRDVVDQWQQSFSRSGRNARVRHSRCSGGRRVIGGSGAAAGPAASGSTLIKQASTIFGVGIKSARADACGTCHRPMD
jgi:hypothetical protein